MKKIATMFSLAFLVFFTIACENEKSLQSYLVESTRKEGFFTGDLPVSSLISVKSDVSREIKETMKSIKKINVAFLKKTDDNIAAYEAEKAILKNIFKSNNYKSLGSVKAKGMNVKVYYTGDTSSLDEVIVFGYSGEAGVGIARLLGDKMNPVKVLEMMNSVNLDGSSLDSFGNIFKGK
tara:strand:- start:59 stop:595 length:537 start_codon:yes stop_codon:yes gene_type:complete